MPDTLHYCDDSQPGIGRRLLRGHWAYFAPDGRRIKDRAEIDRLNAIGLPPAYEEAWFSPRADAHILATGIDARGRKQYRYHPDFTARRAAIKFEGCARFGEALPRLRARVEADLGIRALCRERAIASVLRLLDSGRIRVGNEAYARTNRSFGATTLRRRHARLEGARKLTLRFRAKSGKQCEIALTDRRLIRFVRRIQDLPGQHLFQYLDEKGAPAPVTSSDVNAYLRETMGEDFTARNFRTWRGSVIAFEWLADPPADAPAGLTGMLAHVATHLCNTPAIARKAYVHPALIDLARDGTAEFRASLRLPRRTRWLDRYERGLIALLKDRHDE